MQNSKCKMQNAEGKGQRAKGKGQSVNGAAANDAVFAFRFCILHFAF
jgi:hypothetical protein